MTYYFVSYNTEAYLTKINMLKFFILVSAFLASSLMAMIFLHIIHDLCNCMNEHLTLYRKYPVLWFVTFFPPKAGLVWKFLPEEAQRSKTVLMLKVEGQSGSFGLLKDRISRLDPTCAGRMTF